jgi:enoyl-CoA hydratase/carnithine racemase
MADALITLEFDGPVAVMTNNRPDKHNAANDAMDARLWEVLGELHQRDDVRAIVWRGNGKSFSSGRDTSELGVRTEDISNLDFIERGHQGTQQFFTIPAPIIVALKGWVIGGSFERALLCDMRIAGESAKMMLPEVRHGVVPDTGGTARLFQMAGHGLAADLALTGRVLEAEEALRHGVVSRVVPDAELDETCLEVAREIAAMPAFAVKMFRRTLARMADPLVKASIQEEAVSQVVTQASDDYAEMKAARAAKREPKYRNR